MQNTDKAVTDSGIALSEEEKHFLRFADETETKAFWTRKDSRTVASVMWRLKLTAHMCDNVYYLRKYDNGRIQLLSKSLMLHSLSNICRNAFELETALEDAYTGFDAASATRKHATYIKSVEII